MPATKEAPTSFLDFVKKSLSAMLEIPMLVLSLSVAVVALSIGIYAYTRNVKASDELLRENQLQRERLQLLETQLELTSSKRWELANLDVFKKLSFSEKATPEDQTRLQAALSLNEFARYTLNHGDLYKAKETLDQSIKTYPTYEGAYYLGVINYAQGHPSEAAALWTKVSNSGAAPRDIYLYLALAEYKSGNFDASRRYSDTYARIPQQ